jgi:transposase
VEYRQAVSEAQARVQRLSEALAQELEQWRMQPLVHALMSLRGVDQLVATTLVAELGDFRRFAHPRELMGYLGLVPSDHTSGERRRLGAITKTGNDHARRVLIEAAWNSAFHRALRPHCRGVSNSSLLTSAPSPGVCSCVCTIALGD